ncbi:hypothetical protein E2320_003095 [Naja naja]|nr:hypothetical protein E2320_003095 [Naja naja]
MRTSLGNVSGNIGQHGGVVETRQYLGYCQSSTALESQPLSACSESCHPGSSKKVKEEEPFRCYDCILCPDGKISEKEGIVASVHYERSEQNGCVHP